MHFQTLEKQPYQCPSVSTIRCVTAISIMSNPAAGGDPLDPVDFDEIDNWN